MEIKIISEYDRSLFESRLTKFIEDKNIIDIKYACSKAMSNYETLELYSALIMYDKNC
jgi:hypothetical protein